MMKYCGSFLILCCVAAIACASDEKTDAKSTSSACCDCNNHLDLASIKKEVILQLLRVPKLKLEMIRHTMEVVRKVWGKIESLSQNASNEIRSRLKKAHDTGVKVLASLISKLDDKTHTQHTHQIQKHVRNMRKWLSKTELAGDVSLEAWWKARSDWIRGTQGSSSDSRDASSGSSESSSDDSDSNNSDSPYKGPKGSSTTSKPSNATEIRYYTKIVKVTSAPSN
uniref:Uncharacterized protein n=1 Tax=Lygus hesperus TaxID=30085 RepID=A0A0A9Y7J9_LYGHE